LNVSDAARDFGRNSFQEVGRIERDSKGLYAIGKLGDVHRLAKSDVEILGLTQQMEGVSGYGYHRLQQRPELTMLA
jgi:hypothetical protein